MIMMVLVMIVCNSNSSNCVVFSAVWVVSFCRTNEDAWFPACCRTVMLTSVPWRHESHWTHSGQMSARPESFPGLIHTGNWSCTWKKSTWVALSPHYSFSVQFPVKKISPSSRYTLDFYYFVMVIRIVTPCVLVSDYQPALSILMVGIYAVSSTKLR
jgi:hypothetical protein